MPVSISAALQKECYISASQEEVLANLGEGWENSVDYVLDETPSQHLANLDAASRQHGGRSRSESSESEEMESHRGFVQEPGEWTSPPSRPAPTEAPEEVNRTEKEDSYNAAFESDRSQSPTRSLIEEHGEKVLEGLISMGDMSVQPITQPPVGMLPSQSPTHSWNAETGGTEIGGGCARVNSMGDMSVQPITQPPVGMLPSQSPAHSWNAETGGTEIGGGCARVNRSAEPDSQPAPEVVPSQFLTESRSPSSKCGVCQGRVWTEDMSAQPITQPPFGTQPSETQTGSQGPFLETLLQPMISSKASMRPSCSNRMQGNEKDMLQISATKSNAGLPVPAVADVELENTLSAMEDEDAPSGSESRQQLLAPASGTDRELETQNRTFLKQQPSRHVPHYRGRVDVVPDIRRRDSERVAVDEPQNFAQSQEVAGVEVELRLRSPPGAQTNAVEERVQDEGPSSQGPAVRRIASIEECGRGKKRRTDSSPLRVRISPKTVMDVVRSRSIPLSDSMVDDSCSILSVALRAGVSFPPFVHRKHSL